MALANVSGDRPRSYSRTRILGWILAGSAALLLVVVVSFVALAHRNVNHWLAGVPRHLGANIQQETNSFTYDQSLKGKKIFTVHASKEIQHRDGTVTLHDVGIVLYGPAGQTTDRIHGSDFEFDPKAQSMQAHGDVYIDLVPPTRADASLAGEEESRLVHVKTVGLRFSEKDQLATTEGAVEFHAGGYTGNAIGASYDAKAGVVILQSAVHLSGIRNDKPVVLTAARAEMDRASSHIDLRQPKFVSASDQGSQSIAASHAVVVVEPDGTPRHADAEGNVTLSGDRRGTVIADHLQMDLGPQGQARTLHLFDHVRYQDETAQQHEDGHADDTRLTFDASGKPQLAVVTGNVRFDQRSAAASRSLEAANVDLHFINPDPTRTEVQSAKAFGPMGAHVTLTETKALGTSSSDLRADVLDARFAPAGGDPRAKNDTAKSGSPLQISALDGTGHTLVMRTTTSPTGEFMAKDTTAGAVLHAVFEPGPDRRAELARAEQTGSVTADHEAVARTGAHKGETATQHARANDLVYEAAAEVLHMNGAVSVEEDASLLSADRIDFHRATGDADASGSVKATYTSTAAPGASASAAAAEPLHVLADHATAHKAAGLVEFAGGNGGRARLWQGSSQIQAPVIDLYRADKRLIAHGDKPADNASVTTVLTGTGSPGKDGLAKDGLGKDGAAKDGPMRVTSRSVTYADLTRTIDFAGPVHLTDRNGTIAANSATVWLAAKDSAPAAASTAPMAAMAGKVDHLVALGNIAIAQPGRQATGDKLVYTAADGVFLLTGTSAQPPRIVDPERGSTTGAALRFTTGDNTVEVLGTIPSTLPGAHPGIQDAKTTGRVRSETRMK